MNMVQHTHFKQLKRILKTLKASQFKYDVALEEQNFPVIEFQSVDNQEIIFLVKASNNNGFWMVTAIVISANGDKQVLRYNFRKLLKRAYPVLRTQDEQDDDFITLMLTK